MSFHYISEQFLGLDEIEALLNSKQKLALSDAAKEKISACRDYLDNKMEQGATPIYGINTGFGSLCDTQISNEDLGKLQENLVISHACGMGAEIPQEIVRLMLLLKIQGLSQGHSGVQLLTIERLIDFYNANVLPVIYEQGSLGASGDLAPLAHLSLPLLGYGEVNYAGKKLSSQEVNKEFHWDPIALKSKEGLALLNGTQFMSAYAVHCLLKIRKLSKWSDAIACISLEAYDGRIEPFNHLIHQLRPHAGQIETAATILDYLKGSAIVQRHKAHVQDPYCLRCIPQVHGATKDSLQYAIGVVETEINSVTDNPTIFYEEDLILSAGNFHGQPLALILDFLGIAVAELGSISERRSYKLLGGNRGLPAFLVSNPGLNSGFMIAQYAAASAVSQNKQLATPASVDTIDSSNGQEDHVSMGANAATKLARIVDNVENILAIELFSACQALDFRTEKSSVRIQQIHKSFREKVPFLTNDEVMYPLIEASRSFIRKYEI